MKSLWSEGENFEVSPYITGLPLRSCWTIEAPYVDGAIPMSYFCFSLCQWCLSNPHPHDYQANALPLCYAALLFFQLEDFSTYLISTFFPPSLSGVPIIESLLDSDNHFCLTPRMKKNDVNTNYENPQKTKGPYPL